jgi:hypothetical protein
MRPSTGYSATCADRMHERPTTKGPPRQNSCSSHNKRLDALINGQVGVRRTTQRQVTSGLIE